MADRFCGAIFLGGKVRANVLERIEEVCDPFGDEGMDLDGSCYFYDCTGRDFDELKQICKDNGIALMIQWDAKYEYDGIVEYYIDGKHSSYTATNSGDIVVRLCDLEEHPCMFIRDYIKNMEIPNFPNFEVIDD